MKTTIRTVLLAGALSFCAAGLNVQGQTASPGPNSRNANVDKEDPNKPNTQENAIPNQEAPGSGHTTQHGAAGTHTPTGGDGSATTENNDVTQPIQNGPAARDDAARDCEALSEPEKERCEEAVGKQTETLDASKNRSQAPH